MAQNVSFGHRATSPTLTAPDMAGRPSPHVPNEMIAGKYRLLRRIGRGGMGDVWAAEHIELKTEFAIKFCDDLARQSTDLVETTLTRFRFEAQASARLGARTKHIVAVHDAGTHEGLPYLVMELVQGTTLDDEITNEGRLEPERVAEILEQVAEALQQAHAIGIVHRDIKPSNIMLTNDPNGRLVVKLADFGVAKAIRGDATFDQPKDTAAGYLVGSPAYMSPEQVRATGTLTPRCDVWSLGVVAYEALVGWAPFSGDSLADLIVAITTRMPPPPSTIRGDLPRAMDAWFERVLAKEADERFDSVIEMAEAFRAALEKKGGRAAGGRAKILAGAAAFACIGFVAVTLFRSTAHPAAVSTNATESLVAQTPPPPTVPPVPVADPAPEPTTAFAAPTTAAPPPMRRAKSAPVSRAAPASAHPAAPSTVAPPPTRASAPPKEFDKSEIQ